MATHDDLYWYKNVLRKQLKLALRIYLSLAIIFSPIFLVNSASASAASAALGGWKIGSSVGSGIGKKVTATKDLLINGASKVATGAALVTPDPSDVASFMKRFAATALVVGAVDLLLDGVDWVLDPANNSIQKNVENPQKCYYNAGVGCFASAASAASAALSIYNDSVTISSYLASTSSHVTNSDGSLTVYLYKKDGTSATLFTFSYSDNPSYDSSKPEETKQSIPLSTVATQILEQAENDVKVGNPSAAVALSQAVAQDIINQAENDKTKAAPIVAQLEQSASIETDESATANAETTIKDQAGNVTGSSTSSISLDFPVFCSWAPSMCVLADKVQESITDAREWATSEPQQKESENLHIEDLNIDSAEVNLSASTICPKDSVSFSLMGIPVTLDMPYQPFCDALNFFKPAVLLAGAVASVYIVAGVRTKEEDQA